MGDAREAKRPGRANALGLAVALVAIGTLGPAAQDAAPRGPHATDAFEAPAFWGELRPGAFPVGFTTRWAFDPARDYRPTFGEAPRYAGPRPILINAWYPAQPSDAEEQPMAHGDYLALDTGDPRLESLAIQLGTYAHGVIAEWAIGQTLGELDPWSEEQLALLLETPTAARRDARSAEGSFPLVLYHAGYGSSYEDNAVLCEYLASHGYVVVGSAYQDERGGSFNIDGKAGSTRDFAFLIGALTDAPWMPCVDTSRVGVVGHSGGAHATLEFQAQPAAAVDAVVSLDTTQDYVSALDPHWGHTAWMLRGIEHERAPMLVVAKPHAYFEACDLLVHAERTYLTFRDLDHNDYTLQGVWTAEVAARRARANDASGDSHALEQAETYARAARRGYEQCTDYVRLFLDRHLKEDAAAEQALATLYRSTPLGGAEPHVELAPVGTDGPAPYDPTSERPPTPREAFAMLDGAGAAALAEVLATHHARTPEALVFQNQFGYGVFYGLVAEGRIADAQALAPVARRLYPNLGRNLMWWVDRDGPGKHVEFKRHALEAALILDPGKAELRERLESLPSTD